MFLSSNRPPTAAQHEWLHHDRYAFSPFIIYLFLIMIIFNITCNSFGHSINLELFAGEVALAAIHASWLVFSFLSLSSWQLEVCLPRTACAECVLIGITWDHKVVAPKGCRLTLPIENCIFVILRDRVLLAQVDTEEEAARVCLAHWPISPVGTRESSKDEVIRCLDYSESGSSTFTAPIEILITPSI